MFEKRKNSDKRTGISFGLAVLLLLGGLFVGINLANNSQGEDAEIEISSLVNSIDLSGEWIGTTTQDYSDESHYDYRITIEQSGTQIIGMSYLDMINDYEIYAEERIEGYVTNDALIYSEVETLLLENASLDQWCLTETTLSYQIINGQETLVGSWEYVGEEERCEGITGRVILTRQPD